MSKTKVTNVPNDQIESVKNIYMMAGATSIVVTGNGDGTSDLLIVFPNSQDHASLKAIASPNDDSGGI